MNVVYADKKLERLCTSEKEMRKRRPDIAQRLPLRIAALEAANSMEQLVGFDPLGRWHRLSGDLDGQWAGKLTANWRLLVRPDAGGGLVVVTVLEIADYH